MKLIIFSLSILILFIFSFKEVLADNQLFENYTVKGKIEDQVYTGELDIIKSGEVWDMNWVIDRERFVGVGILDHNYLAVCYSDTEHINFGITLYKVEDSALSGYCINSETDLKSYYEIAYFDNENIDLYNLSPTTETIEGIYSVTGYDVDNYEYSSSVSVERAKNNCYFILWEFDEYWGVGFADGDKFIVGWFGMDEYIYGVSFFNILSDSVIEGPWAIYGEDNLCFEKWEKLE